MSELTKDQVCMGINFEDKDLYVICDRIGKELASHKNITALSILNLYDEVLEYMKLDHRKKCKECTNI